MAWGCLRRGEPLEAHLSHRPRAARLGAPLVVLLVSGGHTFWSSLRHRSLRLLGQTIDDAAVRPSTRSPAISGSATGGRSSTPSPQRRPNGVRLPRALPGATYDFSFRVEDVGGAHVERHPRRPQRTWPPPSGAVVDVLVARPCAPRTRRGDRVCLAGEWPPTPCCGRGSARPRLRGDRRYLPSRAMCTDNAAMVARRAGGGWRTMDRARSRSGRPQPVLGPHRLIDSRARVGRGDGGAYDALCRFRASSRPHLLVTGASSGIGSSWPPSSPRAARCDAGGAPG